MLYEQNKQTHYKCSHLFKISDFSTQQYFFKGFLPSTINMTETHSFQMIQLP